MKQKDCLLFTELLLMLHYIFKRSKLEEKPEKINIS